MFCSNCGAEAEGNFCKNCGAPLPKEEPSTEKSNESIDAEYKVYDEEEDQKQKDNQKNACHLFHWFLTPSPSSMTDRRSTTSI